MSSSEVAPDRRSTRWKGKTTEVRTRERRAALIAAALAIAASSGIAAIGVRAVCRQARLTERYFYESFTGIDDLITSTYAWVVDEANRRIRAAMDEARRAGASLPDASIGALVHFLAEDAGRSRFFNMEQTSTASIARQLERKRKLAADVYADLFRVADQDPLLDEADLRLNAEALLGSQTRLILKWADGSTGMTEQRFVQHMVAMYRAVAAVRSSGGSDALLSQGVDPGDPVGDA